MFRFNFANDLTSGPRRDQPLFHVQDFLEQLGLQQASSEALVDGTARLLLQRPPSDQARQALMGYINAPLRALDDAELLDIKVRGLIHLIMCMPAYQLS